MNTTSKGQKLGATWKLYDLSAQPKKPTRLEITDRDIAIFWLLSKYRFLTIDQITELVGGGRDGIRKRLQWLHRAAYIYSINRTIFGQNHPAVFCLGNLGAKTLTSRHGLRAPKVDWVGKNKKVKSWSIRHKLRINDFLVKLQSSVRDRDDVELIPFEQILRDAPSETRGRPKPNGWRVMVTEQKERKLQHEIVLLLHKIYSEILRVINFMEAGYLPSFETI